MLSPHESSMGGLGAVGTAAEAGDTGEPTQTTGTSASATAARSTDLRDRTRTRAIFPVLESPDVLSWSVGSQLADGGLQIGTRGLEVPVLRARGRGQLGGQRQA